MNILAIDPGTTTGLAWVSDNSGNNLYEATTCKAEDINENWRVIDWIAALHDDLFLNLIVIERFATAGMLSKYGLQTIDLVGQVKGWCRAKRIDIEIQTPQSRRAWLDKAEQILPRRLIIHEKDAMSHLLQYLEHKKILV